MKVRSIGVRRCPEGAATRTWVESGPTGKPRGGVSASGSTSLRASQPQSSAMSSESLTRSGWSSNCDQPERVGFASTGRSISIWSSSSFEIATPRAAKMSDSLAVVMNGHFARTLTRLRGGQLRFKYDDPYRTGEDPVPLSISMPTQVRTHADRTVSPWLWGLLPGQRGCTSTMGAPFHTSASSPFSLLGTPVGEDCAGAVGFVRFDKLGAHLDRAGAVSWLTEGDVAQRLQI